MNKKEYQQVFRAQFSSLTNTDIKNAFNNLEEYPNCQLSMSVDARSIIDYKVGISFSKLFTYEILNFIDEENISDKKYYLMALAKLQLYGFVFKEKKKKIIISLLFFIKYI